MKIAAVFRSREYSPNHIGTDAAILNEVCEQLRKRGFAIEVFSEERLVNEGPDIHADYKAWITMARSPRCIETLKEIERRGATVINSGFGIENCRRGTMCRLLSSNNIPVADFLVVDTDELILDKLKKNHYNKCWIKQSGAHSMHKEDVTFVRHREEAQEILQEYFMRGIRQAVICRHLTGELIRFYGVNGTGFFKWFMPMDDRHYAPDSNEENHQPLTAQQEEELQRICSQAAEALDLKIYGGDCILLPSGEIVIIDVNDWPSFAPVRKSAASYIARYIQKLIR